MVLLPDGPLPTGPEHLCLDAMVLIGWNNAGCLELLGNLVGPAFTADVIVQLEIKSGLTRYPQNQAILDASWLTEAPVRDEDAQMVSDLTSLWGSGPRDDMGEAEIVALAQRHGWTAITDDKKGRGALEFRGLEYAYGASLLICAAACEEQGLDAASAWDINRAVEPGDAPHLGEEAKFHKCVDFAKKIREHRDISDWKELVRCPYVDYAIDRADGRHPPRPRRELR
jgi:hypothetical protein